MSEYTDDQIDSVLGVEKSDNRTQLRQSLLLASDTNPDEYARTLAIARESNIAPEVVEIDPPLFTKENRFSDKNIDFVIDNNRELAGWMLDQQNAKLVHDDITAMTKMSDYVRSLGASFVDDFSGRTIQGTGGELSSLAYFAAAGQAKKENAQARGEMFAQSYVLPNSVNNLMASAAIGITEYAGQALQLSGEGLRYLGDQIIAPPQERRDTVDSFMRGLGQGAGSLALASKGRILSVLTTFAQGSSIQIDEALAAEKKGKVVDDGNKAAAILSGGLVTAATEMPVYEIMLKRFPAVEKVVDAIPDKYKNDAVEFLGRVLVAGASEATQEALEGAAQRFVTQVTIDPERENYSIQEAAGDAALGGAVGGTLQALVFLALHISNKRVPAALETKIKTEEAKAKLTAAGNAIRETKLAARDPEKLRELIKAQNTENKTVVLDGTIVEQFNQSGIDMEEFYNYVPSARSQFDESVYSGSDIEIPLDEFLSAFATAPEGSYDFMRDFIKINPDVAPELQGWDLQNPDERDAFIQTAIMQARQEHEDDQGLEIYDRIERQVRDNLMNPELMGEKVRNAQTAEVEAKLFGAKIRGILQRETSGAAQSVIEKRYGTKFQIEGYKPPIARKIGSGKAYYDKLAAKVKKQRKNEANSQKSREQKRDIFGRVKKKKEKSTPTPIINYIAAQGGIDPESSFARDMKVYVNQKTHPRLFKKGSNFRADSIPVSDIEDALGVTGAFSLDADSNGYVDLNELKDAIRNETFGDFIKTPKQIEQQQLDDAEAELLSFLDDQGVDITTASAEEIDAAIQRARESYQQQFEGGDSTYYQSAMSATDFSDFISNKYGVDVALGGKDILVVSAIKVPKEERNKGIGTKVMKEIMRYADQQGKVLALTPTKDFGGNLKKLNDWYKKLGFVKNEGKNKDFRTREKYIREPKKFFGLFQSASKNVTETQAFKKWFGDRKVVDENGKPLVVYHGTKESFEAFDLNKLGRNGMALGAGFYFSNSKELASGYGETLEVYLSAQNPTLSIEKKTITKAQVKKIVTALEKIEPDFLSNYGDISYEGRSKVFNAAMEDIFDTSKNDADVITTMINVGGIDRDDVMRAIVKATGKDGFVVNASIAAMGAGENDNVYTVLLPEQIKSVFNQGTFDPNDPRILNQENRGAILFGNSGERIIKLFEGADESTLLHEMGHEFLDLMGEIAAQDGVTPEFKADYDVLLDWLGAKAGEKISVDQHEKFARGFEAYLYEGKSPSIELRSAFDRFRLWLVNIYKSIKSLNVSLTDDVRAVFDRMLATDEEIDLAKGNPVVSIDNATLEMLSKEQRIKYIKAKERAYEEAKTKLFRKAYRQHKRKATKFWKEESEKVQADVESELKLMPVYRAINYLQTGEDWAGKAESADSFKLSEQEIIKIFDRQNRLDPVGKYELKYLPRGVRTKENGLDPRIVADFFGFKTALDMLKAMQDAEPFKLRVQKMTEDIMISRHGDMLNDGSIEQEALAMVIANDTKSAQIELQSLSERTGVLYPSDGDFEKAAQIALGSLKVDTAIKPEKYYRAALKAAREYGKALGKGQFADDVRNGKDGKVITVKGAASWKRQEILNKHLYKLSRDARDETNKAIKYFTKLKKRPAQRNAKAVKIDPAYHEKIWDLLDKYNLDARMSDAKRTRIELSAINSFIQERETNENAALIMPPELVSADSKTHYRDMTLSEFRALNELIKNLDTQGRAKRQFLLNGQKKDIDEQANKLLGIAEENTKKRNPKAEGVIGKFVTSLDIVTSKMAQVMTYLDGGSNFGEWMQSIYIPVHNAETQRWIRARQEYHNFNALMKEHYAEEGYNFLNEEVGEFNREPFTITRERMIMLAMYYTGTPATRQKLIDGYNKEYGWDESYIERILENMGEKDWSFVMKVRDYLETFWAETSEIEARRFGYPPEKQDALPDQEFKTKEGKLVKVRGGYMRIIYDPDLSVAAANNQTKNTIEDMKVFKSARSMTKNGSMIEQVDGVRRPMLLSFDGIVQHLTETVTHITMAETVDQTLKILHHDKVQKALFDSLGRDGKNMIDLWLQDVVSGGALAGDQTSRYLRAIRRNYTVGRLGLRPVQAILQVSGLFQAMGDPEIGRYIPAALAAPITQREEIFELSSFMRERKFTLTRDIADSVNYYKQKGKFVTEKISTLMLWPLQKVQEQVDLITWSAAYRKATLDGMSQDDSVTYANLALERLQGGGSVANLSGVERGTTGTGAQRQEWIKAAFGFYSYFNAKYNIAKNANIKFQNREISAFDLATTYMMVYMIEGLVSATILGQLDFDWDDDDNITPQEVGLASMQIALGQFSASVPFLRDVASGAEGFEGGSGTFGQIAGLGKFSSDLVLETNKAIQGEEINKYKLIREGVNALNVFVPFPASIINQFTRGMQKEEEEGDAELLDYLVFQKK